MGILLSVNYIWFKSPGREQGKRWPDRKHVYILWVRLGLDPAYKFDCKEEGNSFSDAKIVLDAQNNWFQNIGHKFPSSLLQSQDPFPKGKVILVGKGNDVLPG